MNSRKTYEAIIERDGSWWFIQLPDLGRATQSRRLDQAEAMVRDLVALVEDVAEDSFDVELTLNLDPDLSNDVISAVAAKGRAAAAQTEASNELRRVAHSLTDSSYTLRDVGALLGVTHQRIAQLLATPSQDHVIAAMDAAIGDADKSVDVYEPGRPKVRRSWSDVRASEGFSPSRR